MKTIDIFKTNIEIDKLYHKLEEEDKKIFFNIMDAFDNCVVENDKKDKEIERLNNIINELEKYLIEEISRLENVEQTPTIILITGKVGDILDELRNLKGDESDENII